MKTTDFAIVTKYAGCSSFRWCFKLNVPPENCPKYSWKNPDGYEGNAFSGICKDIKSNQVTNLINFFFFGFCSGLVKIILIVWAFLSLILISALFFSWQYGFCEKRKFFLMSLIFRACLYHAHTRWDFGCRRVLGKKKHSLEAKIFFL